MVGFGVSGVEPSGSGSWQGNSGQEGNADFQHISATRK
jgi:hypothetical protein